MYSFLLGRDRSSMMSDLEKTEETLAKKCGCSQNIASQTEHCRLARFLGAESLIHSSTELIFSYVTYYYLQKVSFQISKHSFDDSFNFVRNLRVIPYSSFALTKIAALLYYSVLYHQGSRANQRRQKKEKRLSYSGKPNDHYITGSEKAIV